MDNNQSIPPTLNSSIASAKTYIRKNWEEGVHCPCCGRLVKLYKRKITSAMAYGLILLHKYAEDGNRSPTHIEKFFKHANCPASIRGDFSKFKYWGIIREVEGFTTGHYVITKIGFDFVTGRVRVPKKAHIYNDVVYGFSDEMITIAQALKDKYNYKELMGYEIRSEDSKRNIISSQQNLF